MTDTSSRPTRPSQTKIVATLGPASSEPSQIADLLKAGVDVFRVNMAHGSREQHEACLAAIRGASAEVGQQAAVLIDLAGPKIRLGELPGGEIHCAANAPVRFVRGETARDDPIELTTTYETLVDELDVGDRIMLADGTVSLAVEQVDTDSALCRVTQSGPIRSRQGVNLPGVKLSTPALSPVDPAAERVPQEVRRGAGRHRHLRGERGGRAKDDRAEDRFPSGRRHEETHEG